MRNLRGGEVTYVSQSAAASFNPAKKIMDQVIEAAVLQKKFTKAEAESEARSNCFANSACRTRKTSAQGTRIRCRAANCSGV